MIVVLPDQGVTIRELLSSEQYTREMFGRIDELESYGGIYWKIPKFRTAATADLGPSLAGLGLTDAFDVSRADFTGITGESLSLSGVINPRCSASMKTVWVHFQRTEKPGSQGCIQVRQLYR